MNNIRPIRDRILVKRAEAMKQSAGGIFIPETTAEKPEQGVIVDVGSGKVLPDGTTLTMEVTTGETIIFVKGAGQAITVNGEEYLVMREEDILAVIN